MALRVLASHRDLQHQRQLGTALTRGVLQHGGLPAISLSLSLRLGGDSQWLPRQASGLRAGRPRASHKSMLIALNLDSGQYRKVTLTPAPRVILNAGQHCAP